MKSVITPQHESIDYTHTDIINHKNIAIFEANYVLDNEYKNWFDNKYLKKNVRLPIPIIESLDYIKSIT